MEISKNMNHDRRKSLKGNNFARRPPGNFLFPGVEKRYFTGNTLEVLFWRLSNSLPQLLFRCPPWGCWGTVWGKYVMKWPDEWKRPFPSVENDVLLETHWKWSLGVCQTLFSETLLQRGVPFRVVKTRLGSYEMVGGMKATMPETAFTYSKRNQEYC